MAQRRNVENGIAESTLHLLRTRGARAVTVEAVAAHSGIAKTTIYRRHQNRRDMLAGALSGLASPPPLPPEATAQERLRWLIVHAVEAIEDGVGIGGFAAMLTDEDPEFSSLFRQILVDQRGVLATAIEQRNTDGAMRDDIDFAALIDAVVGGYIAERARTGVVAAGWEQRLFDLFWPAVRA